MGSPKRTAWIITFITMKKHNAGNSNTHRYWRIWRRGGQAGPKRLQTELAGAGFKRTLAAKRLGKRLGLSGQQISKYKSTTDGWRSLPVAPNLLNGMVQSMSRNGNC